MGGPPRRRKPPRVGERPPFGDRGLEGAAWQTRGSLHWVQPRANPPAGRSSGQRRLLRAPRGAVPKPHRPSRRSSRSASSTPEGFLTFGSFFMINARGGGAVAERSPPCRSNLASRPSGSSAAPVRADTRRATGRPRSVMTIVSPCRTRSIKALSWFFASVIVAFFIWLK